MGALEGVVTYMFTVVTEVANTIAQNGILLVSLGITVAGAGIGLAKKLMGTGGRRRR